MYRVTMKKNTLSDTRTAERMPTRAEFDLANVLHISDVNALVASFVQEMIKRVNRHDWTKVNEPYATMFYDDMKANKESGKAPFEEMEWYKHHVNNERHHLKDRVPDDVDLIDVIEMLADCVSAGMTRSGHVYEIKIPDSVLQKAVFNTVKKMIGAVEITEMTGNSEPGRWKIETETDEYGLNRPKLVCSKCKKEPAAWDLTELFEFCPNCGTKMGGGIDD